MNADGDIVEFEFAVSSSRCCWALCTSRSIREHNWTTKKEIPVWTWNSHSSPPCKPSSPSLDASYLDLCVIFSASDSSQPWALHLGWLVSHCAPWRVIKVYCCGGLHLEWWMGLAIRCSRWHVQSCWHSILIDITHLLTALWALEVVRPLPTIPPIPIPFSFIHPILNPLLSHSYFSIPFFLISQCPSFLMPFFLFSSDTDTY